MDVELEISRKLKDKLKSLEYTISAAESCTSGTVCDLITRIPGSSDYFKGGVIAYSNEVKTEILSVPAKSIKSSGAVSEEVAEMMCTGIKKLFKTDIGISTTGIAGPGGGSVEKPVGMVFMGVDIRGDVTTNIENFDPPREKIKKEAAISLLKMLNKLLEVE